MGGQDETRDFWSANNGLYSLDEGTDGEGYSEDEYTEEGEGTDNTNGGQEFPERQPMGKWTRFCRENLGGTPVDWIHRLQDSFKDAFVIISDPENLGPVARDAKEDQVLADFLYAYSSDESLSTEIRQACTRAAALKERNLGLEGYVEALGELGGFGEILERAREYRDDALNSSGADIAAMQGILAAIEAEYESLDPNKLPENVAELVDRCSTSLLSNVSVDPKIAKLVRAERKITRVGQPTNKWLLLAAGAALAGGLATAYELGSRSHESYGTHPSERVITAFTEDSIPEASASGSTVSTGANTATEVAD